jgi:hypothetical protein
MQAGFGPTMRVRTGLHQLVLLVASGEDVVGLGLQQCRSVLAEPVDELAERAGQADAHLGQGVRHLRRDRGLHRSVDDPRANQRLEVLRQHFLADAVHPVTQLEEPVRAVDQRGEDQRRPPVRHLIHDRSAGTVAGERVRRQQSASDRQGWHIDLRGIHHGTRLLKGAYLLKESPSFSVSDLGAQKGAPEDD